MKKGEGAPKEYPITHIAQMLGENEDFDTFVQKLCDEISTTKEEREETIEPLWEDCEENYWATEARENAISVGESNLNFTDIFETCKQASSNISNPVFAQDKVFTATARPGFQTIAATHDHMLDWIADRSDYEPLVNDSLRHAEIYPKATVKIPWQYLTRKIRYWDQDDLGETVERESEEVYKEGSFPYVMDPRRLYHPLPCPDIDEAPWWAEEFDTRPAEIKQKIEEGYYRQDLNSLAIGDTTMNPQEDKEKEEFYIANSLEGQEKNRTDFTKLKLMEVYTSYEGAECVIIVDVPRRTWLAAHSPFYQEFPRPYATFCWHQVTGSIDGKSLCAVTDQLHRAYVAIMNILLDAGLRAIEPLVLALKELKLGERMVNGRLGPGLQEVEKLVLDKISDGIHEIRLSTGEITFLLTLLERIERHIANAASIPPAFYGEELASRPTATGTTSVLEKAMQPLYELMTRYRKFLTRIIEIQYSQYRQFNPKSMRIFIEAQSPQESKMMQAMLVEFPPGYWRDQVILEPKVNSQIMSQSIKKQEALAMVDKWPVIVDSILALGEAATSGGPISPIAGNALDVFDLVIAQWLTVFDMPEVRDAIQIQGSKVAGQAIAQAWQQLQAIIEEQQQTIIDHEAQIVDLGGEVAEQPAEGVQPAGGGPPEASA
jgi:hypothetical protein